MISDDIKQQVIELRKQGKTYPQIHELTGVAKSSISDICRPLGLGGKEITLIGMSETNEDYYFVTRDSDGKESYESCVGNLDLLE